MSLLGHSRGHAPGTGYKRFAGLAHLPHFQAKRWRISGITGRHYYGAMSHSVSEHLDEATEAERRAGLSFHHTNQFGESGGLKDCVPHPFVPHPPVGQSSLSLTN